MLTLFLDNQETIEDGSLILATVDVLFEITKQLRSLPKYDESNIVPEVESKRDILKNKLFGCKYILDQSVRWGLKLKDQDF